MRKLLGRVGFAVYVMVFAPYELARFILTGRKAWEDGE
jgi:hypothetical protein